MTVSANTVWEIRAGGSDTNGGGFVTGASGTDWSLQNGTQYSVTDGVTAGTTTITSATAAFGTDVVGNIIYVQGGTGSVTAGWYQIISRTNATTIVVDRSTGLTAGTGVTLHIGGAFASVGTAAAVVVSGNIVYVKYNASAYAISSASTNISGGCVSSSSVAIWTSYDTTRTTVNTDANRSTLQIAAAVSSATIFAGSGIFAVRRFILDGNSQTTSIAYAARGLIIDCKIINFSNSTNAVSGNAGSTVAAIACEASGNNTTNGVFGAITATYGCVSHDNTGPGFGTGAHTDAISYNNTLQGFLSPYFLDRFVAYNNTSDGVRLAAGNSLAEFQNGIVESNGGYGINVSAAVPTEAILRNVGSYLNTSGRSNPAAQIMDIGAITGSGSFFTNAASGDFSLNNTAGAGASARAAGYPGLFPAGLTTGYPDIGAAQHQDAGVIGSRIELGM